MNWTPAKTRRFQACYWMAWLLAGCFQITFFFLYFGKPLLARLFAEPMVCDEPILCASPVLPSCVYGPRQWVHTTRAIGWTAASGLLSRYLLLPVLQQITAYTATRGAHGATSSPLHALFLLSALSCYGHRPPPASAGRCCRLHGQRSLMRQFAGGLTDGAGLANVSTHGMKTAIHVPFCPRRPATARSRTVAHASACAERSHLGTRASWPAPSMGAAVALAAHLPVLSRFYIIFLLFDVKHSTYLL